MIITVAGKPGSGKSTVSRMLAEKLGYAYHSAGLFTKDLAAKKGVSLNRLIAMAENDPSIDKAVDDWIAGLAKKDKLVLDARLGFHFIPGSFKIFLDVDLDVSAERLYHDAHSGEHTLAETKEFIKRRLDSEILRFSNEYHVNHFDLSHYNLVLVTSALPPERIVQHIMDRIKRR